MQGYLGRDDLTEAAFHDGWYITGDLGFLSEDGFLKISGRLSRFSKIGGEMVPHGRVEEALQQAVGADAQVFAVTAVGDERKGEKLAVLHTLDDGQVERALEGLGAQGLPNLFIPRRENFIKVDAIPVLGTGKLDLKAMRRIAEERSAPPCRPVRNRPFGVSHSRDSSRPGDRAGRGEDARHIGPIGVFEDGRERHRHVGRGDAHDGRQQALAEPLHDPRGDLGADAAGLRALPRRSRPGRSSRTDSPIVCVIDRREAADVDDLGVDAFGGEPLGGLAGEVGHQQPGEDRHVAALRDARRRGRAGPCNRRRGRRWWRRPRPARCGALSSRRAACARRSGPGCRRARPT